MSIAAAPAPTKTHRDENFPVASRLIARPLRAPVLAFYRFARAADDEEMYRHRLRQASNLLGPSGLISLEDGAVFNRLHRGSNTLGTIAFQKGADEEMTAPCFVEQNDEASNLIKWERYREIMGFQRG